MPESTEQTKKLDALLAGVVEETITAKEFADDSLTPTLSLYLCAIEL